MKLKLKLTSKRERRMLNKDLCRIIALKLGGKDALNFFSTCKTLNRDENYAYYLKHKYKEENIQRLEKEEGENKRRIVYIIYCEKMIKNIFDFEYQYDKPFTEFIRNMQSDIMLFVRITPLIKDEKIEEFKFLVNNGYKDMILIHNKIISNKLSLLKILLEKYQDVCKTHKYMLIYACKNGDVKIVRYLLKNGFDVNMFNDKPLIEAMLAGKLEVLKYLLRHGANFANVNSEVLAKVRENYPEIIEFLKFYFLGFE